MAKLKKITIVFFTLLVVLVLYTSVSYAASVGTVTCDGLNVRQTPSTSAKIVTMLAKNSKVSVITKQNDWLKISANGKQGWVLGQYLSVKDVAIGTGTISANNVNLRKEPNTSATIVLKVNKSLKLTYYQVSGDWYRVKLSNGTFGWVRKDFFSTRTSTSSRSSSANSNDLDNSSFSDSNSKSTDLAQKIVAYSKKFLGVKYVYGAMSPSAFDCSGFTTYVFKHFGIKLARSSHAQGASGKKISKSELRAGDLVFFDTNGGKNRIEHVGLYIGAGKFIHASSGRSNRRVVITSINDKFYRSSYMGARRYIP
jgi:cell wall-associated NlpC family hydrolase